MTLERTSRAPEARHASVRLVSPGIAILAIALLSWALAPPTAGAASAVKGPVSIGVVVDGPWAFNDTLQALTANEIGALTEGEFEIEFPPDAHRIGDWTLETAQRNLRELLADPEVDLVITWGLIGSHLVCCFGELPKPVIAPVILDADLQGLSRVNGASGVKNLSYVALPDTIVQEVETFRDIVPFRKLAVVSSAALLEAIPEIEQNTSQSLEGTGIDFEYVPARESAEEVLAALPADIDAVYVWPLFQFGPGEYRRLIDGFIDRGLPSFSGLGGGDVEAGMLATTGTPEFFPKLSRRIALNVQRILLGEEPGEIPVDFSVRERLVINMATARAIDVSPRWEVLIEAELLHAEPLEGSYRLDFDQAVSEALQSNVDLAAERRSLEASVEDVRLAVADLLPQLDLTAGTNQVDRDRAAESFGNQPERSTSVGLGFSHLLFSPTVVANRAIQRELLASREHELQNARLDTALEAGSAYLNLLRARAFERIQRNNVDRTRSNLEVAQVRREVGAAAAGEVVRWESEIASARQSLVSAVASRRTAEIALNRLLHRDLDAPIVVSEIDTGASRVMAGTDEFETYVGTPRGYRAFTRFVVGEGLERSPALAAVDASVRAQQRFERAARLGAWAPSFSLQGSLEEIVSRSGAGADMVRTDDTNWSLGLFSSLPLFTGGARGAVQRQAAVELERLGLLRTSLAEKIEQGILIALEQARASRLGMELADQAADAARENLDLVVDAYVRGAAALLDLLDAQTAALNAEEVASDARYDFLLDFLEAKRAASAIEPAADPSERADFMRRLQEFLAQEGALENGDRR